MTAEEHRLVDKPQPSPPPRPSPEAASLEAASPEAIPVGCTDETFSGEIDVSLVQADTSRTEAIGGAVPPGTHVFFCKYHRARGMDGEITVTQAG